MGKGSRVRAQRRVQAAEPHVKIMDAAQLVRMAGQIASVARRPPGQPVNPGLRQAAAVADVMLDEWRREQIVVRADREFIGALLDSDTDVPLVPDWLDRMPFGTFACSLAEPMRLSDGNETCYYRGFIATGFRTRQTGADNGAGPGLSHAWTTYGPLPEADGIRFLWLFNYEADPAPQAQTVSVYLKGDFARKDITVGELATLQKQMAAGHGQQLYGTAWGQELAVLLPLSVQFALYMAAQEPDLDWIPGGNRSRHRELGPDARVGNVGWRVGAAIRTWRKNNGPGTGSATTPPGPSGWRLPPHIRRAHWHRVRVATRDQSGAITGSRSGVQGTDWHYEMRWFPPAPVNVSADSPLAPAIREISAG